MPWQKGQSGNPAGGRKGSRKPLTATLRRVLAEPGPDGRPKAEMLAEKLWGLVEQGNLDAIKYIYDRLDGKPGQAIEVTGRKGKPLLVEVRAVDYRAAVAPLSAGPDDDSDAPGEDEGA